MGTDIENIQNAYKGFARGNYTMLDNLALGYAGTKEEMQRLLEDAEKVSGIEYDISSYADIVDAIHVVQTEMGITGTTALEASTTIQGSLSSLKAAWTNLVTGLGDENADLDTLIDNLVTSAETAAGNLVPVITRALSGMGQALNQLAPVLVAELPGLVEGMLPPLISAGAQLLVGLVTGLVSALPALVEAVPGILDSLVTTLADSWPALQEAGGELISMLSSGILTGVPVLVAELPALVAALYNFLADNLPKWVAAGGEFIGELLFGIIDAIPDLVAGLPEVIYAITSYVSSAFPQIVKTGAELLGKLLMGIIGAIPEIIVQIPDVIEAIVGAIEDGFVAMGEAGGYLLMGLWEGIAGKVEWLKGKIMGVVDTIKGWFTGKDGFDEHSPSKWAEEVGAYVSEGLANGIEKTSTKAQKAAETMAKNIYSGLSEWADKQVKYNNLTLQDQLEMWRAIQTQFVEDSEYYAKAEAKVYDLKAEIQEEYYDKVQETIENIADLEENYQTTLSERVQDIADSFGLFDEVPERQKRSGAELTRNLKNQISVIEEFYTGLDTLMERGVSGGLLDDIREMGPSAVSELSALLNMSDEKLDEYVALYEEKQQLANEIATKELEGLRGDTTAQIAQSLDELYALYESNGPELGTTFTDGLAEGIFGGIGKVTAAASSMAEAALQAVRDAFSGQVSGLDMGAASVDFASSGLGMSSAATVNALSSAAEAGQNVTLNATLVAPDGTKFANYYLPSFIKSAAANGTPIANPQTA